MGISIFLIPALMTSLACAYIMINFFNSKSPGKQTLIDLFLRNGLIGYCLNMIGVAIFYILSIMSQEWSKEFSIVACSILFFFTIYSGICISYIPLIRYFSIFMPFVFAEIDDQKILRNFKRLSFFLTMTIILLETCLTNNISQTLICLTLSNDKEILPYKTLPSMKMVLVLILIFYLLLNLRLEIHNFEFKEGYIFKAIRIVKYLKLKLKMVSDQEQSAGQFDLKELGDYNVNLPRIALFCLSLSFIFFFKTLKTGWIYDKTTIQIAFIDILLISVIIEDKRYLKNYSRALTAFIEQLYDNF